MLRMSRCWMIANAILMLTLLSCTTLTAPRSILRFQAVAVPTVAQHERSYTEQVYKIETNWGSASCWVISCQRFRGGFRTVVVTAGHIEVEHPPYYLITGQDENGWDRWVESTSISVHPSADIMLLEFITESYFVPRTIDSRQVAYGEVLWLEGFPAGFGPYLRKGYSSGADRLSTDAWPGDSGGPISDADGEVVGILVATLSTQYGLVSFAARMVVLADISDWLGKELQRARFDEVETTGGEDLTVPAGGSDLGEPELGG